MNDAVSILKHEIIEKGRTVLNNMESGQAEAVIRYVLAYIIREVEIGLGIVSVEGNTETPVFEKIDDVYREAARRRDCYFCSGTEVDPNAEEFSSKTKICIHCMLKLANYTKAMGIEPRLVFPMAGERKVQKSVVVLSETPPEKLN